VAASALIRSGSTSSGLGGNVTEYSANFSEIRLEGQPEQSQILVTVAQNAGILSKGRLAPRQWVSLSFAAGGKIDDISVREGDMVFTGKVLARLDGGEGYQAKVAAAELELLQARQAMDDLNQRAGVELALAEQRLAEARKVQDAAGWKVKRMKKSVPQLDVEQAHANLLML
jgi:multidrug efflux pump subunit AcrA (membrane-fusion protein)